VRVVEIGDVVGGGGGVGRIKKWRGRDKVMWIKLCASK
jgi:hypothetical protein